MINSYVQYKHSTGTPYNACLRSTAPVLVVQFDPQVPGGSDLVLLLCEVLLNRTCSSCCVCATSRLLAGPLLLLLPGFQRGDAFGVSFASRPPVLVGSSEPSSIGRVRLSSSTRRARHSPGYRGSVDSTSRPSGHRSDFSLPEMAWNKYSAPTTAQVPHG